MAKAQCLAAIKRAIGRDPTAKELKDIEDRLRDNMRALARTDPVRASSMSARQRLDAAAQLAAQQLVAEAAKAKQRVALSIIARQRLEQYMASHPGGALDAIDDLVAFNPRSTAGVMSLETRGRAIARNAERQLLELWEQGGDKFLGLFQDKAGIEGLIREIHGEDTGNPDAKAAAAQWHRVAESMRQAYNDAGGVIGKLDDWGMPHHHSAEKVAKVGRPQWVAETMPLLDRDRYRNEDGSRFDDNQMRDFLDNAWLSIASRGANKIEPGAWQGAGMRANRHAQERQIHFKDAGAFIEYQRSFGDRGLFEILVGHVRQLARDQALIEVLGPNPDHAMRRALDQAYQAQAIADPIKSEKAAERTRQIEKLYNLVAGRGEPIADRRIARWADSLKNLLVASRLGSALISSIGDESTMYLTSKVNGLNYAKVFQAELTALNPANQAELRMARRAGLALDTMIGTLARFGDENLGGRMGRIANASMRASGLNAITEARQRAFGVVFMDALGHLTRRKSWDDMQRDDPILASKGVTRQDWAIWKKAKLEDFDNDNHLLTPEGVAAIPDNVIGQVIGSQDVTDIRRARSDAIIRLIGATSEEVDMAIITPGIRDQARASLGQTRGTLRGELVRSVFLFKSFPLAMIARHWGRAATMTGGARAGYIASLLATTTVLGALAVQASELVNGRDPRAIDERRFWIAALLKGGSLGVYGDFLFSSSSQHGGSAIGTLLGPAVGLLEEAGNLTQGNMIELLQGEDPKWEAEAVKFIKGITPGASLWYAKAALDHLIFQQLQEHFSPGYLNRVKRRARTEFNQEYWWEPGHALPDRGPDFDRVSSGQ